MSTPHDIILQHALSTLPDSLRQRRILLEAIMDFTAPNHPARKGVNDMLYHLIEHEHAQKYLPLEFYAPHSAPHIPHSKDGHHKRKGDGK